MLPSFCQTTPFGLTHMVTWLLTAGDPTLLGWGTTVAYLAAVVVLLLAFRRRRGAQTPGAPAWVYLATATLMLLLGVNKELDLHASIETIGRQLALEQGWYEQRRFVQRVFVVALLGITAAGGAMGALLLRRAWRSLWLMALGVGLVGAYALVRAAYFHHVDLLGAARVGASPASFVIELVGIACVGIAAARAAWSGASVAGPPEDPGC
ncbi:MAG: hypothetical protein R3B40_25085 [Polyangiales bacterium]